jgi:hypothetical protein
LQFGGQDSQADDGRFVINPSSPLLLEVQMDCAIEWLTAF